jgi:hypothetical protein
MMLHLIIQNTDACKELRNENTSNLIIMFDSQKDINTTLMCIKISEKENLSHPEHINVFKIIFI